MDEERGPSDGSEALLAHLRDHRPAWAEAVSWLREEDGTPYLELTFAPPAAARASHPLVLSTRFDDLTLAFDAWHTHVDWPTEDWPDPLARAVALVDDLLAERLVAVSVWKDGGIREALGQAPGPPWEHPPAPGGDHEVRVRSFHGTHDADWACVYPRSLRPAQETS